MNGIGYQVNAFMLEMREALCNQPRRFHRLDHEVVSVHKDQSLSYGGHSSNIQVQSVVQHARISNIDLRCRLEAQRKARTDKRTSIALLSVKQCNNESLKDYIDHFMTEARQVEDFSNDLALSAMMEGIKYGSKTWWSIQKHSPKTFANMLECVQKYSRAEDAYEARRFDVDRNRGFSRNKKEGQSEEESLQRL
ncbi:hypothetical protein EZV62_005047 [Acer yangbiense]|uniref:Retrotransposon gag domain-containing protein n=1 Tax=Acer yangbiense TaxID=1000413 RepID=A0A5C7INU2_9ROSI|nr:hypothetical protein EZV62_005047 [Acer yangbiense]